MTSPSRYILLFFGTVLGLWASIWSLSYFDMMQTTDGEYPMWKVKIDWKNQCRFGSTVIFGDSTALAGFKTPDLGADYTNFALGGATTIEAYYMLQHLLACPNPPKRVILSFQPYHFVESDWLWRRTFSWGALSLAEAYAVHKNAMQLKDYAYFSKDLWGRLSDDIAIWFHMTRFPTLRFGSLLYSLPFGRLEENNRVYKDVARDYGYHTMGTRSDLHEPNNLAILDKFVPSPLNTWYLKKNTGNRVSQRHYHRLLWLGFQPNIGAHNQARGERGLSSIHATI